MKTLNNKLATLLTLALSTSVFTPAFAATSMQALKSDGDIDRTQYTYPDKAKKAWRIGVIVPNSKENTYWLSANYGLAKEAKRLGVRLKIVGTAKNNIQEYNKSLDHLANEKVDAIIFAPMDKNLHTKKLEQIAKAKKIPLISMINPINSHVVKARAEVSCHEKALHIGQYLAEQAKERKLNVLLLPGSAKCDCAKDIYAGLSKASQKFKKFKIRHVKWGKQTKVHQAKMIRSALEKNKNVDYIIGNSVAAKAAVDIINESKLSTKIMATRADANILNHIKNGKIVIASTDYVSTVARRALDVTVNLLEGRQYPTVLRAKPSILNAKNAKNTNYTDKFAPLNYKATQFVNWK